ncbi:methyltransferase domain-containing protein [Acidicapsa ligni]|uniref:methyltransferase domain-containing protein n=1 Tax=Acidicapsa ligni TaxID=542300 RepID=UPI0021E014A2|nr:methyltransferase domain-containing protein [Acidicapsa ligni]
MSFNTDALAMKKHPPEYTLDFSQRAYLSELMDEPCSYEDLRDCLRDLAQVNRVLSAYRPTLQWLEQFMQPSPHNRPLHIVDVGCGGGDMLRHIERWALRKKTSIRLTGIDMNPNAIRAAQEFTPANSRIRWFTGKSDSFNTTKEPVDLVISSLFTHHLSDEEIMQFLQWMESVAQRGWFISDLCRSKAAYRGFEMLARVARWHPFVRHDGPVSICRALRPAEWPQYAYASGLSLNSIRIETHWPGRLSVSRSKL